GERNRHFGALSCRARTPPRNAAPSIIVGCDFGSTTAKAVVLDHDGEMLFSCYALSQGNPIEDAKELMRQIRRAGHDRIAALALTGYGKDLLVDILGADLAIVETVAHAQAALHFFPDADVICDVGGCDVKVIPATGHGGRLPAQLAMLIGQWSLPAGRCRALRRAARGLRGASIFSEGHADAHHGMRRLSSVG